MFLVNGTDQTGPVNPALRQDLDLYQHNSLPMEDDFNFSLNLPEEFGTIYKFIYNMPHKQT